MNETNNQPRYDYGTDDIAEYERLREQRVARRKKRQRQQRNRRILLCGLLLLIAVTVFLLILSLTGSHALKGTWEYGETATVQFEGKDRGVLTLLDTKTEYTFSYTVHENIVQIDFDNTYIESASYTFSVENDTLVLSGEDGTTGDYTLTRPLE